MCVMHVSQRYSFYRVHLDKYLEVENKETVSEHVFSPHQYSMYMYMYITYTEYIGIQLMPVHVYIYNVYT